MDLLADVIIVLKDVVTNFPYQVGTRLFRLHPGALAIWGSLAAVEAVARRLPGRWEDAVNAFEWALHLVLALSVGIPYFLGVALATALKRGSVRVAAVAAVLLILSVQPQEPVPAPVAQLKEPSSLAGWNARLTVDQLSVISQATLKRTAAALDRARALNTKEMVVFDANGDGELDGDEVDALVAMIFQQVEQGRGFGAGRWGRFLALVKEE